MNHSSIKQITGAVLISAGLMLAPGGVRAAEDEAETEVVIPATTEGIWQAIDGHVEKLNTMIAKGELESIHLHAYAVRDLVRELPGRSSALSADERAKVTTQGKFIDTLAERLDEAGDSSDEVSAISNLRKLEKVLKMIGDHYPPKT